MDEKTLDRANWLKEGIRELAHFIDSIERIGNCSWFFFKRERRFFVKREAIPWVGEIEYKLDQATEKRMLEVLRERLAELKTELESL